jgi:hypothetical protein
MLSRLSIRCAHHRRPRPTKNEKAPGPLAERARAPWATKDRERGREEAAGCHGPEKKNGPTLKNEGWGTRKGRYKTKSRSLGPTAWAS